VDLVLPVRPEAQVTTFPSETRIAFTLKTFFNQLQISL
jgi:hypothetical protein